MVSLLSDLGAIRREPSRRSRPSYGKGKGYGKGQSYGQRFQPYYQPVMSRPMPQFIPSHTTVHTIPAAVGSTAAILPSTVVNSYGHEAHASHSIFYL